MVSQIIIIYLDYYLLDSYTVTSVKERGSVLSLYTATCLADICVLNSMILTGPYALLLGPSLLVQVGELKDGGPGK